MDRLRQLTEEEKELKQEVKRELNKDIFKLFIILILPFLVQINQSLVCDKIINTCNSKILGFNTGSVTLSQVQSADFGADARHGARKSFQTYNTKLNTKSSQSLDFYFLHSTSAFKAQDDSRAFNDFLKSNKTHFEAKSGLASLAFWQFF